MDLNIVTTQPEQPDGDPMVTIRAFYEILDRPRTPPRVLVGEHAYQRLIAAGARPELLTLVPLVPEETAVVLDVDRIERECERRLAELRMGPL